MVLYTMEMGMGSPWILRIVYLFVSVRVMLVLPTLIERFFFLNKKKEKVDL